MRATVKIVTIGLFVLLAGCNTMKGMGQDVQSGGKAISNTATDTEKKM